MKLVHRPLMGGLLHLVQHGQDWAVNIEKSIRFHILVQVRCSIESLSISVVSGWSEYSDWRPLNWSTGDGWPTDNNSSSSFHVISSDISLSVLIRRCSTAICTQPALIYDRKNAVIDIYFIDI